MKYTIDRFEGEFAVCEDEHGHMVNIAMAQIPKGAVEGDVIIYGAAGFEIDAVETNNRRERISELAKELWQD